MSLSVHLFQPPLPQRTGGLDTAIRALESYLREQDVPITVNSGWLLPPMGPGSVVHFHGMWRPEFSVASYHCRRLGIPYLVSPHGMLEPWAWRHKRWKKRPWYRLVEQRHLEGAAVLHSTSTMEADNLRKLLPGGEVRIVPLGIGRPRRPDYEAARNHLGWTDRELVLLYLSRIHPKKGLDLLLQALAEIPRRQPPARLVIVGGGHPGYVAELKRFIARNEARLPRVDWIGEIWNESKWRFLEGADLFCLPSHSENFGLAILEALQVGTRVLVSTETPWAHLENWNAAYVARPDAGSVKHALTRYLSETEWPPDRRDALSNMAQRTYGWDQVGPAYLDLYRTLRPT